MSRLLLVLLVGACGAPDASTALLPTDSAGPPAPSWWRPIAPNNERQEAAVRLPTATGDVMVMSSGTTSDVPGYPAAYTVRVGGAGEVSLTPLPLSATSQPTTLAAADLNGDGAPELIATFDDRIDVLRPGTWQVVHTLPYAPASTSSSARPVPVDADGDGRFELLLWANGGLALLNLRGEEIAWTAGAGSGPWVAEVDGTPGLEVVQVNSGQVLDLATLTTELQVPALPGQTLAVHDLDGDGLDEVILHAWDTLRAVDPRTADVLWTLAPQPWAGQFEVNPCVTFADLGRDGAIEMLVPRFTDAGQVIEVHDPETGAWLRSLPTLRHGAMLTCGLPWDPDGDGADELLWAGHNTPHRLDLATEQWLGDPFFGSTRGLGPFPADVDGDGQTELVISATGEFSDIAVLDASSREVRSAGPNPAADLGDAYEAPPLRAVFDVDGDGDDDAVLVDAFGRLTFLDLATDGPPTLLFTGSSTAGSIRRVHTADLDGDGQRELLLLGSSQLAVWDTLARASRWRVSSQGADDFTTVDLDSDGLPELVLADDALGSLRVLNGLTGAEVARGPTGFSRVTTDTSGPTPALYAAGLLSSTHARVDRLALGPNGLRAVAGRTVRLDPSSPWLSALHSAEGWLWVVQQRSMTGLHPSTGRRVDLLVSGVDPVSALGSLPGELLVADDLGWRGFDLP